METTYKSSYCHDLDTHKEFTRSYSSANLVHNIIILTYCFLMIWFARSFDESYYIYRFLVFSLLVPVVYWIIHPRKGDIQYKRILQSNGGQPQHQQQSFSENGLHVVNSPSGNQATFAYDQFRYVIESKNLLILVMRYRSCIIIEKSTLSGGSIEAFFAFLKERCPKLRGRKPRKTTFGRWCHRLFVVIFVVCTLWALLNLPGFAMADRIFQRLHNDLTYQEMSAELSELDIDICLDTLHSIEEYDADYLEENAIAYYDGAPRYQKVADLLYWEAEGIYHSATWWDPSNSGVYWIPYYPQNPANIYTYFLRGISSMDEKLAFTNVQEDLTGVDAQTGYGTAILSFDWEGNSYSIEIDYSSYRFDRSVIKDIAKIINSDSHQLYISNDDSSGALLYYGTVQNARKLNQRTTLHFKSAARKLF